MKSVIILYILSALFFLSSISMLAEGNRNGIGNIIFALILAFVAYRKQSKNRPKKQVKKVKVLKRDSRVKSMKSPKTKSEVETEAVQTEAQNEAPMEKVQVESPEPARKIQVPETVSGYIRKYVYDDVVLTDTMQFDTATVEIGKVVDFHAEPSNLDNPEAISIYISNKKIGYMPNNKLQEMCHDYWKGKGDVYGLVSSVSPERISLIIGFYLKVDTEYEKLMKTKCERKVFRLTGNKSEEMQDDVRLAYVGDEVTVEYDFDNEKYEANCGVPIGYFPKSADNLLEDDFRAFVSKTEENNSDKTDVYVTVFII